LWYYVVVGNIFDLLLSANATEGPDAEKGPYAAITGVCSKAAEYINTISLAIVAMFALALLVYAVQIGIKMGMASDDAKRNNARAQLIYALMGLIVISIVAAVAALAIPNSFNPDKNILNAINEIEDSNTKDEYKVVYSTLLAVVKTVLAAASSCVKVFAIYVGWQFIKAEDEKRRTDAKWHLVYSLVGICVIIALEGIVYKLL
jgi:Na+/proline symporter